MTSRLFAVFACAYCGTELSVPLPEPASESAHDEVAQNGFVAAGWAEDSDKKPRCSRCQKDLMMKKGGWCCHSADGEMHIVPIDDTRQHDPSTACWCEPRDEGGTIFAHNSADHREQYERGERKPS
jgi:hypothetical protein